MSNKSRSFKLSYKITFQGKSRGQGNKGTFQEELIKDMVISFGKALTSKFKTLYVDIEQLEGFEYNE